MTQTDSPAAGRDPLAFLAGGGEMGARIRAFDWSTTPLGPVEGWPQSFRSALSICLNASFPIGLYWGGDLVLLYNDDWSPILGAKHPWALGRPAREAWPEIWSIIAPLFEQVLTTGEATRRQDQLLPMRRHGFTEECYFDYTFSPVRGEGGTVDGVFNAVLETTTRVVGERRLRTLRALGDHAAGAKAAEAACQVAASTLAENPYDLPFALLYLLEGDERRATLAGLAGLGRDTPASSAAVDLEDGAAPWPFRQVAEAGKAVEVADLSDWFGPLPGGAWPESPRRAVVLPMANPGQAKLAGFVVAGVSPRLPFTDDYKGFLDLLAGHVATAVANARAYEEEKRRAEALAELDRAKTAFFSNVSHEFRTPLTLMLGPVDDLLGDAHNGLPAVARVQLGVVGRNGQRLLRLVNTLLDFSRIEAGRVRAVYEATDLAAFTADLASNFRSACERAGLRLVVDCPPLGEPAYVDRDMWEKVVLNLVSNAFKFTFDGEIAVTLRRGGPGASSAGGGAELRVTDTGIGIPALEVPRLFERFHRIENARGRTHEGSGIGLALVQELVKLHGGSVTAESVVGQGTTFTVTIPLGSAHLPADRVGDGRAAGPAGAGAGPYVEEVLRWLPGETVGREDVPPRPTAHGPPPTAPRVLVADDNADMRQYVARLLAERYAVEAVPDGEAALAAARGRAPDLVLTDVMMPRLDGFGLLRELRADPRTADVPVIMLSARAGEESRVEGMEAGVDDYLVKPFSARELLARVAAHLQMARLRREAGAALRAREEELREGQRVAHVGSWRWDAATDVTTGSDELYRIYGLDPAAGAFPDFKAQDGTLYPHESWQAIDAAVQETLRTGAGYELDVPALRGGEPIWVTTRGEAVRDAGGAVVGLRGTVQDVTERRRAEERLRQSELRLRKLFDAAIIGVVSVMPDGRVLDANDAFLNMVGYSRSDLDAGRLDWKTLTPPDILAAEREWVRANPPVNGRVSPYEKEYVRKDGARVPVLLGGTFLNGGDTGEGVCFVLDITDRKRAEGERERLVGQLQEQDRRKDEFLATLAHELRNPLAPLRNALQVMKVARGDPAAAEQARAIMERQLGQMVRLIDDLMDLSRISRGKVELRTGRVELAAVVRQAVETSRPLIEAGGHELTLELPAEPVAVDADATRLAQVFSNLLSNAAKYTEYGGRIRLAVAMASRERQRPEVVVSVADTGVGIPAAMLPKVFDMFTQVDRSLEKAQGGLGIGLSLVKTLVEMHGGTVEAKSGGHGQGSEFVVRLPVARSPAPEAAPPGGDEPPPAARRRVLVADDNADAAASLATLLRVMGHEVRTANDGLAAVEAAAAFRPDVALLDIGMPRLNGYDAARRIREQADGQGVVLIALTGWGQEEDRRQSKAAGFDHHVVKPVDPAVLERLLAAPPAAADATILG